MPPFTRSQVSDLRTAIANKFDAIQKTSIQEAANNVRNVLAAAALPSRPQNHHHHSSMNGHYDNHQNNNDSNKLEMVVDPSHPTAYHQHREESLPHFATQPSMMMVPPPAHNNHVHALLPAHNNHVYAPPVPHRPSMMINTNNASSPYYPWSTPLCHLTSTSRYAFACLCPCTILSDILTQLLGLGTNVYSPSDRHAHGYAPTVSEICCSLASCSFFPCLSAYRYTGAWPVDIFCNFFHHEEEEEEVEYQWPKGILNYICLVEEEEEVVPSTLSNFHRFAVPATLSLCLASVCLIPTTCIMRRTTTVKFHRPNDRESIWTSGLISCFAWPCALVQTMDEIKIQETAFHHRHYFHTPSMLSM